MTDVAFPAQTLYRPGKLVRASLDLDSPLKAIVDAAHQLIESESTAILLLENGAELAIRAGCGLVVGAIGRVITAAVSKPGLYSDTECELAGELAEQAAAP